MPRKLWFVGSLALLWIGMISGNILATNRLHPQIDPFLAISLIISCSFFLVGSGIYLSRSMKKKRLAFLIFSDFFFFSLAFAVQTASNAGDPFFSTVGTICSPWCFFLLSLLLASFPSNRDISGNLIFSTKILLFSLFLLTLFATVYGPALLLFSPLPSWMTTMEWIYYALSFLLFLWFAFRPTAFELRSRLRTQKFLRVAILFSFLPLFLFSMVPALLQRWWPQIGGSFVIDEKYSTLSLCFFPLSIGLLLFQEQSSSSERALSYGVRALIFLVSESLWFYLFFLGWTLIEPADKLALPPLVCLIFFLIGGWIAFGCSQFLARTLIQGEGTHYQKELSIPSGTVDSLASLLCTKAQSLLQATCVLWIHPLNREGFFITPASSITSSPRHQALVACVSQPPRVSLDDLILRKAVAEKYPFEFVPEQKDRTGPILVVPVRFQEEELLAILTIERREDAFVSSELALLRILIEKFCQPLNEARWEMNERIVTTWYNATRPFFDENRGKMELCLHYLQMFSNVLGVRAEFWHYLSSTDVYHLVLSAGTGPTREDSYIVSKNVVFSQIPLLSWNELWLSLEHHGVRFGACRLADIQDQRMTHEQHASVERLLQQWSSFLREYETYETLQRQFVRLEQEQASQEQFFVRLPPALQRSFQLLLLALDLNPQERFKQRVKEYASQTLHLFQKR